MGLFLWLTARDQALAATRSNLLEEARLVASAAAASLPAAPSDSALQALAGRTFTSLPAQLSFILPSGVIVGNSTPNLAENLLTRPEVAAALGGGEGADTRSDTITNISTLYAASPILLNGKVVAVARLALPLT